jgi:hypothetical protein
MKGNADLSALFDSINQMPSDPMPERLLRLISCEDFADMKP